MALMPAFIWGEGGQRMTPEEIAQQRRILEALAGQADTSPVGHWSQGAARMVNALGGVLDERRLDKAEAQNRETNEGLLASLLGSVGGSSSVTSSSVEPSSFASPAPVSATPTAPMTEADPITSRIDQAHGDMTNWADAIASIESAGSGDYAAIGPSHPELGRALGRYQVMEANIGPWSQAALGREVTADEFLANPELQDAIFNHQFGGYVDKYGPQGAAQAWFGGEGGVGHLGRQDSLGTSIGEYTQKFTEALGGASPAMGAANAMAQQPIEVAQSGGINPAIIEALTSPYADEQTRGMAQILLEQELQRNDPSKALEMEIQREKLNQLRNPRPETTAEMQNLQWRAAQAGLQPGTEEYSQFMLSGGRGPETVVNNNIGNSDKFVEESDKAAASRLNDIVVSGSEAATFMGDLEALQGIATQIETGKGAQVMAALGPYAEALGVEIEGLGEMQAYEAIVARMAPQMRPPGSGASSDFDARQFLYSLPSLGNTPEGNQVIIQTFEALQNHKLRAAEIASKSFIPKDQGGITWQEAERQIRELGNPYQAFNEYRKTVEKGGSGGKTSRDGTPSSAQRPADVPQELWDVMTPEERALWQ